MALKNKRDNLVKMYDDEKMYEDERNHFGMYHGRVMYGIIKENDLWDLEYNILKELTYAIRAGLKYHRDCITNKHFNENPKEYYIDRFELRSFSKNTY